MNGFRRMIAPIEARVRNMVARGVIARVNDDPKAQELQIDLLADETASAERFHDYGFTSHPPAGAEALVVFPGGTRSHGIVVAVADRAYRMKAMQSGEVALYDDQGQYVLLGRDGITIHTDKDVTVNADKVTVQASTAKVFASQVKLGEEGGPAVARVGDPVVGGVITAGSSKVFAA